MSFTPTDAQAGKTVTATVTVTYSDKSTDTATVTFKVAAKTEPEPKPEPTDPKADLRKEVESASKLDEKDYTADSWKVFAAALDNAKAVLEDKDATEAQISGALTTLKSATAALARPATPQARRWRQAFRGQAQRQGQRSVQDRRQRRRHRRCHAAARSCRLRHGERRSPPPVTA